MESQPQNPEFRINPKNCHPCEYHTCRISCEVVRSTERARLDFFSSMILNNL